MSDGTHFRHWDAMRLSRWDPARQLEIAIAWWRYAVKHSGQRDELCRELAGQLAAAAVAISGWEPPAAGADPEPPEPPEPERIGSGTAADYLAEPPRWRRELAALRRDLRQMVTPRDRAGVQDAPQAPGSARLRAERAHAHVARGPNSSPSVTTEGQP